MIENTGFPIVMTANDPFDQKFSTLRKKAKLIEFHTLSYITIANVLKDICKTQKIEYDDESINALACRASGDLRSAIIDLFILCAGSNKLSIKDMDGLFDRKRELSILDGVTRILKTTDIKNALSALEDVDEDLKETFLWIDENLPKEYKNPEDIEKAYNALSRADVFNGRIKRWQYWRFLVYVNFFLTAGVAMAKKDKYSGFTKIERPGRILKMWISNAKNDTKKKIAQKLSKITHKSAKYSFNVVPFIQIMCQHDNKFHEQIAKDLKLDEKEKDWLAEKEVKI
jgi:replication factor C large subunit